MPATSNRTRTSRPTKRARRAGFTLIELLVVVVIIGILASVSLPAFGKAQDRARGSACHANVHTAMMGLEQFGTDHDGTYPTTPNFLSADPAAPGLGLELYLPGNKLPRSPWSTTAQTDPIPLASPEVAPADVADGASLPTSDAPAIAQRGNVAAKPAQPQDYGAISYALDDASQTYVLYATGKQNTAAVVGAGVSNNGH